MSLAKTNWGKERREEGVEENIGNKKEGHTKIQNVAGVSCNVGERQSSLVIYTYIGIVPLCFYIVC